MELRVLADEYLFECECRKLSSKTVENYRKQITYFLEYLKNEYGITKLEEVKTQHIKHYLMSKQKAGNKPNYINDLLKVCKTMFKFFYEEGYTDTLITEKVKNVKKEKVIIRTFSKNEIKKMIWILWW